MGEERSDSGSIIIVVATDAPMMPHQLKGVARRAAFGIARSGGIASNESGDRILAFSSANGEAVEDHAGLVRAAYLGEKAMSRFYEATIEAVDEAIMNSLFANETMVGRDGHRSPGFPTGRIAELLA